MTNVSVTGAAFVCSRERSRRKKWLRRAEECVSLRVVYNERKLRLDPWETSEPRDAALKCLIAQTRQLMNATERVFSVFAREAVKQAC